MVAYYSGIDKTTEVARFVYNCFRTMLPEYFVRSLMRWASYLIRIYARKLADQRWNNTGDGDIRSGERLERRLCIDIF